nr:condensation domain-containing protein [uncultured Pedobacter sp.]
MDFEKAIIAFCEKQLPDNENVTNQIEGETFIASPLQARWYKMHSLGFGQLLMPVFIDSEIDTIRMSAAILKSLKKYDALRMNYEEINNQVTAKILSVDKISPPKIIDISNLEFEEQYGWLKKWILETEKHLPNITHSAPIETFLIKLSEDKYFFILHTHHICFDGWSATILWEDINNNYFVKNHAQPNQLSYRTAANHAWEFLLTQDAKLLRARWQSHFLGAHRLTFPLPDLDIDTNSLADKTGQKISYIINSTNTSLIKKKGIDSNVPMFTVLMSAFALFLSKSSGELDVILGTTTAGRSGQNVDNVVGVFVNPLPIRVQLDSELSIKNLILKVSDAQDLLQSSQNYPLMDLIENVPFFNGSDLNETFYSYILYQNFRKPKISEVDSILGEPDDESAHQYLSAFNAEETTLMRYFELIIFDRPSGELSMNLWYRKSIYSKEIIKKYSDELNDAIEFIVDNDLSKSISSYLEH